MERTQRINTALLPLADLTPKASNLHEIMAVEWLLAQSELDATRLDDDVEGDGEQADALRSRIARLAA